MASLAHMTPQDIVHLTSDGNDNAQNHVIQENMEEDNFVITHGDVDYLKHLIDVVPIETVLKDDDSIPFCVSGSMKLYSYGSVNSMDSGGMIMYMDGFRVSLKGGQPCLNLYFESWTLDSRNKFLFAMVLVVVLGILTECISKLRFLAQHSLIVQGTRKRIVMTALHSLQALVGYVLMLATMTYSLELFLSVIVGLGLGYALFYDDNDTHVTTNPCCNFLQDEANERNEEALVEKERQQGEDEQEEEETTKVEQTI